jgi:hypothetical protein
MRFTLHANDPEWVIAFNKRFEEQAKVLQVLQQEMTAMKQLQLELSQTKQQLANALEKIAKYESTGVHHSQPSAAIDMDTDDFPAAQRTAQQHQYFMYSQGTDSSQYAHDYVPSGQRPATNTNNKFAAMAAKLDKTSFKKKPTTAKQKAAIMRMFDAPVIFTEDSTPLFNYVYFENKFRTKISTLRNDLRKVGIDTGRILDIHYPSRGVVAMLMHIDYIPTLTAIFAKYNRKPLDKYDHFSASHVTTSAHDTFTENEKATLSKNYQQTRLGRALTHMRPQIRKTVAKAFALHGWLNDDQIKTALAATPAEFDNTQQSVDDLMKRFSNTTTATTSAQPTTSPIDVDDDIEIAEAN